MVALFYAVAIWSDSFSALLHLNSSAMWPIQMVLEAETQGVLSVGGAATVIIATIPILLVYPFLGGSPVRRDQGLTRAGGSRARFQCRGALRPSRMPPDASPGDRRAWGDGRPASP